MAKAPYRAGECPYCHRPVDGGDWHLDACRRVATRRILAKRKLEAAVKANKRRGVAAPVADEERA